MASAANTGRETLQLRPLHWRILDGMADGRRYTPDYLYSEVVRLGEEGKSKAWLRTNIGDLYNFGLIDKVGDSVMYEITELGLAALALRDDRGDDLEELSPRELSELVRERAESGQFDAPDV